MFAFCVAGRGALFELIFHYEVGLRAGDKQFVYLKYIEKHAFDVFMITDQTSKNMMPQDIYMYTCHV